MSHEFWRKTAKIILLLVLAAISMSATDAEAKSRSRRYSHVKRHRVLPVDGGALYSDIVIEARTGRILRAVNASNIRHPASLTKMMTLYITFQALETGKIQLDQRFTVSSHAASQSPSKLGLRRGQSIRVRDAILGVITESANDAAVVLAEGLGGSEPRFAQMMNRQARALGMKQTEFRNASGLPNPAQVTTARDMAMLAHALIYHYPQYYEWFWRDSFTYQGIKHKNHNRLMERYEGMDGIKTGYVRASGFNLVASAVRNNTRLIGVVFGGRSTASRNNQMEKLLDQGFISVNEGLEPHIYQANAEGDNDPQAETYGAEGDWDDMQDNRYIGLPTKASASYSAFGTTDNTISSGTWGIQIGAYNDAASGKQALSVMGRGMPQLLGRTDQVLQKVSTNEGNIIYRARFMGMEQKIARSICAYLVKHGQGCLIVMPEAR